YPDGAFLRDLQVQGDGSIVAVGVTNNDFAVARLTSKGQLDQTFNSNGHVETDLGGLEVANSVRVTREGILVAGESNGQFAMARYLTNGSLDTTFGQGGKVITAVAPSEPILTTTLTDDGKIVAYGRNGDAARYISATPKV